MHFWGQWVLVGFKNCQSPLEPPQDLSLNASPAADLFALGLVDFALCQHLPFRHQPDGSGLLAAVEAHYHLEGPVGRPGARSQGQVGWENVKQNGMNMEKSSGNLRKKLVGWGIPKEEKKCPERDRMRGTKAKVFDGRFYGCSQLTLHHYFQILSHFECSVPGLVAGFCAHEAPLRLTFCIDSVPFSCLDRHLLMLVGKVLRSPSSAAA